MSEVILAQMFGKINSTIDESMTHHLETQQPFAQSLIWQLQRDYFSNAGIDAWRSGGVPQTITSNPVVGKTYAELVLAFLRDLSLAGQREVLAYRITRQHAGVKRFKWLVALTACENPLGVNKLIESRCLSSEEAVPAQNPGMYAAPMVDPTR